MIDRLNSLIAANLQLANMANFGLVFASQNMPRMVKPYIVMNVMNVDIPDHVIYDNEISVDGYQDIYSWRKATVELQVYNGLESLNSASRLALAIQSENSLLEQQRLDCAIGARLFFAYVPEIVNLSQFEGRAVYQFEFFYTETYKDNVGLIETVIVDGTYTGAILKPGEITCHEEISIAITVPP